MSSDILDWTLSDAPDPDEPPSGPPRVPARKHPPAALRRARWAVGLALGSVLAAAALALSFFGWNNWRQTQALVRSTLLSEAEAASAGDGRRVAALTDADNPEWLEAVLRWAEYGQAAPLPPVAAQVLPGTEDIAGIQLFSAGVAKADVRRRYRTHLGGEVTLELIQFYQYQAGAWKRRPAPAGFWGDARRYSGERVNITYYPPDAAFVERDLAPFLEAMLQRTCADWPCPAGSRAVFLTPDTVPVSHFDVPRRQAVQTGLFYALERSARIRWLDQEALVFSSPHVTGWPVDAAGTELYRRAIALQLLGQLAGQITGADQSANAFLLALVVRQAARLGLEPSGLLEDDGHSLALGLRLESLWDVRQIGELPGVGREQLRAQSLQNARLLLNHLLDGRPPHVEVELLRGLRSAPSGPVAWLAEGLGLPQAEVHQTVLRLTAQGYELAAPAPVRAEFSLSCATGPALVSLGQGSPTPILDRPMLGASQLDWSPDGQLLVLRLPDGQGLAFADFPSAALTLVPGGPEFLSQSAWSADGRLGLVSAPAPGGSFDPGDMRLKLYDPASPQRPIRTLEDVWAYAPAPAGELAALVTDDAGDQPGLYLLRPDSQPLVNTDSSTPGARVSDSSVLSGTMIMEGIDTGWSPAWAPDGRHLAYVLLDGSGQFLILRVASLVPRGRHYPVQAGDTLWGIATASGRSVEELVYVNSLRTLLLQIGQDLLIPDGSGQVIFETQTLLEVPPNVLHAGQNPISAQVTWSGDGRYLALSFGNGQVGSMWLVRPDGSQVQPVVSDIPAPAAPSVRFSADARLLSMEAPAADGSPQVAIYNLGPAVRRVQSLSNVRQYAWSPTGSRLAVAGQTGVYVFNVPGEVLAQPVQIAGPECTQVLWRPAAP